VLRVEDTDIARSEQRFEQAIVRDLHWLGLKWDEGPDRGGQYGPYRQSARRERYRAAAERLLAEGKAYRCFCSQDRLDALRAQHLAAGQMPKYDRLCLGLAPEEVSRRMAAGQPAAIRLLVPEGDVLVDDLIRGPVHFANDAIGDFIILRSDGLPSYNFAAVIDDRDMLISHVIRGDDHLTNTARQLLLFAALGAKPPRYAHHSLIHGVDGGKLSKRHGATAVGDFRTLGYLPQAVVNYLALLSWSHGDDEMLSLERLVADFRIEDLASSAAIFDQAKLDWLQHQYVLAMDAGEHEKLFADRLPAGTPRPAAAALAAAFKPSLVAYGEAPALAAAVLTPPQTDSLPAELLAQVGAASAQLSHFVELRRAAAADVKAALGPTAFAAPELDVAEAHAPARPRSQAETADYLPIEACRDLLGAYREWGKANGFKARELLMPLRIAVTGAEHGPELQFILAALSGGETVARLQAALRAAGAGDSSPSGGAV
jgi:glutamyl-tRNA synthetase